MRFGTHCLHTLVDISYGVDREQRFDLIRQVRRVGEPEYTVALDEPKPILIWFHGGGWILGSKATQWHHIAPFLDSGWHVANVEYRLGPGTAPRAVEDAICAVDWILEHAESLGVAFDRVHVGGASAGAHLALVAGLQPSTKRRVDGIVNFYGITDLSALEEYFRNRDRGEDYLSSWMGGQAVTAVDGDYSPLRLVEGDSPAIFSLHGDRDTQVPYQQASSLHRAIVGCGGRGKLMTLRGGNHGGFDIEELDAAFVAMFDYFASL